MATIGVISIFPVLGIMGRIMDSTGSLTWYINAIKKLFDVWIGKKETNALRNIASDKTLVMIIKNDFIICII